MQKLARWEVGICSRVQAGACCWQDRGRVFLLPWFPEMSMYLGREIAPTRSFVLGKVFQTSLLLQHLL